MAGLPLYYDQPVFRPPSEARSLIIQVTIGCSWNRCSFCDMYSTKKFRIRAEEDVFAEIERVAACDPNIDRVFLADGNALVLKTDRLTRLLSKLKGCFRRLRRVTSYALPGDILRKSPEELTSLREHGLNMLYIGLETGDDELLDRINKGETFQSSLEGCLKARQAGMKLSVMVLNGLGGRELSLQHANHSAQLVNGIQPQYLSTLVLSFPTGIQAFHDRYRGPFTPLDTIGLIEEMGTFIAGLDLEQSVFRSDHASNYLVLKGTLNRDKDSLLSRIQSVLKDPQHAGLRAEWQRGL